jgi:signal transduction histidine kinase
MREGGAGRERPTVAFADVPKLELDQLIDQLVASAEGVKQAQGRLRVLLRAVEMVNADLSLDHALEHIAEAACYVADAERAALALPAEDGVIEQAVIVTAGEAPRRVGARPAGEGPLAEALRAGRSLRLVSSDPGGTDPAVQDLLGTSTPIQSLLSVPLQIRGEPFGQLLVVDSTQGEFSAEDEELLTLLASAAGTTLDNARLFADSRAKARWLRATADVSATLLRDVGEDPLREIARHVAEVAEADVVTVALLNADGDHLVVEVVHGGIDGDGDGLIGRRVPLAESLSEEALRTRKALSFSTGIEPPSADAREILERLEAGPIMMVPLLGAAAPLGIFSIMRRRGAPAFSSIDSDAVEQFAAQAALALELATAREDRQRIELLEDRDRIARDLHDHVIQQLFAIGLSLQGLAAGVVDRPDLMDALEGKVEDIDRTIRQIRTTIFALRNPGNPQGGLRGSLLAIGSELTPALGFSPGFTFAGAVDTMVTGAVADDVRSCVQEALSNVARHSGARRAFVDVATDNVSVTVRVTDDGSGIPTEAARHGLLQLTELAERRGGSCEVHPLPTGGTELIWKAPTT